MKHTGFSRLETLLLGSAAVVTLGLLWPALAQPTDEHANEAARAASCQSNLKQIGLGLAQYTQDYDEKYPRASLNPHPDIRMGGTTADFTNYGWADALQPYIKSTQLFQCPSEKHAALETPDPREPGYTDYWFNRKLAGKSLAAVNSPATTLSLGDGDGAAPQSTARYSLDALPQGWRDTPGSPARRHLDEGNYGFADGHVKRLAPSRLFSFDVK